MKWFITTVVLAVFAAMPVLAQNIIQQSPTTFDDADFARNDGVLGLQATTVLSNTQLKLLNGSTKAKGARRLGFATPGDGGAADYYWSAINCPIPDDGAQVQPTGSVGCWIANLGDTADVRIWTGAPNGTIDNTVGLQAALNSQCGIRPIWIPQVTSPFIVTKITPNTSCTIRGGGWNSWLKEKNGGNQPIIDLAGKSEVTIEGIEFDGNKANNTTSYAPCVASSLAGTYTVFSKNKVHDCANEGFRYAGSRIDILDNIFLDIGNTQNGNAGATSNTCCGIPTAYVIQRGNIVNTTNGPGLSCGFDGCSFILFDQNIIINNGQGSAAADGITAYHYANNNISATNNKIYNSGNHCIHLGGNQMVVRDNDCQVSAHGGVTLIGSRTWNAGTISVTNGSTTVVGSGTGWLTAGFESGGFGGELFVGGLAPQISRIVSDTQITLKTPYTGTTQLDLPYSIKQTARNTGAIVSGNSIYGVASGYDGIAVIKYDNVVVSGNYNTGGHTGVLFTGVRGGTINGNSIESTSHSCYQTQSLAAYGVGTVAVTNGSTTVTGSGTAWLSALPLTANEIILRIPYTGINIVGTVNSDTSITLNTPYPGTTNTASPYFLSWGQASRLAITGNQANLCANNGFDIINTRESSITGNVANNITNYPYFEDETSITNSFGSGNQFGGSGANYIRTLLDSQPKPAVSACGTSPVVANGSTNSRGIITIGSGTVPSCTLTYATTAALSPFFAEPVCIGMLRNGTAVGISTWDTRSVTFSFAASASGQQLFYQCLPVGYLP